MEESSTVYVGNLSCYTNEYQLYELFSRCGTIKRIIMGLDKFKKTPCGFCFVEFDERPSALKSIRYLSRTQLDGRQIQVDMDAGFEEGRQFGRGAGGGQIGDERRRERDAGANPAIRGTGANQAPILTRTITMVAFITLISLVLIAYQSEPAQSATIVIRPFGPSNYYTTSNTYYNHSRGRYVSSDRIREAQMTERREQYEKSFAQFLVNIMKSAKPSLMRAFIQATLADSQLKEIAIAMFFNNTSTDNDDDE